MRILFALNKALKHIEIRPEHGALVALARHHARQIDSGKDKGDLLLRDLIQLGMTRKAQSGVIKANDSASGDRLDELSARREARAKAVDAR